MVNLQVLLKHNGTLFKCISLKLRKQAFFNKLLINHMIYSLRKRLTK